MKPFPHTYETSLIWSGGDTAAVQAPPCPEIAGGPPPHFGGADGHWSPEHLLTASVELCLLLTLQAVAGKSKVELRSYRSRAEGILEKTANGLQFTAFTAHVDIEVAEKDVERARRLVPMAEKYCLVSNSLKAPVKLQAEVRGV